MHSGDLAGSQWASPTVLLNDSVAPVLDIDLALYDGLPLLAVNAATDGDGHLRILRPTDPAANSWSMTTPPGFNSYWYPLDTELLVHNGSAWLAASGRANGAGGNEYYLHEIYALDDPAGNFALADSLLESTTSELSLSLIGAVPALGLIPSATNGNMKYVRASTADGLEWPDQADPLNVGNEGLLFDWDGGPCMVYRLASVGLMMTRAADDAGSSWSAPEPIDTAGDPTNRICVTFSLGRPLIFYGDYDSDSLKVATWQF
jgi:hypothetical protein